MNLKNLYTGQKIKNYKELCTILEEPVKGGKSKIIQLKEFSRYFEFEKQFNAFIIKKIYETPLNKIDLRSSGNNFKQLPGFKVDKKYKNSKGVYCISLNNIIYIGSTTSGFRQRFIQHVSIHNPLPTYQMLKNGGVFKILWITEKNDEKSIRHMENVYINKYKNNPNWIVCNTKYAWCYEEKIKYKTIKVNSIQYENALNILIKNNIDIKFKDKLNT